MLSHKASFLLACLPACPACMWDCSFFPKKVSRKKNYRSIIPGKSLRIQRFHVTFDLALNWNKNNDDKNFPVRQVERDFTPSIKKNTKTRQCTQPTIWFCQATQSKLSVFTVNILDLKMKTCSRLNIHSTKKKTNDGPHNILVSFEFLEHSFSSLSLTKQWIYEQQHVVTLSILTAPYSYA